MTTIPLDILAAHELGLDTPTVQWTTTGTPYHAYGSAVPQKCLWTFIMPTGYTSALVRVQWGADAASGNIEMLAECAAVTPNVDPADYDSLTFDAVNLQVDTHLGTTAGRLHEMTIALTNDDGAAAGDAFVLRFGRNGGSANDTLAGDVFVHLAQCEVTTS